MVDDVVVLLLLLLLSAKTVVVLFCELFLAMMDTRGTGTRTRDLGVVVVVVVVIIQALAVRQLPERLLLKITRIQEEEEKHRKWRRQSGIWDDTLAPKGGNVRRTPLERIFFFPVFVFVFVFVFVLVFVLVVFHIYHIHQNL